MGPFFGIAGRFNFVFRDTFRGGKHANRAAVQVEQGVPFWEPYDRRKTLMEGTQGAHLWNALSSSALRGLGPFEFVCWKKKHRASHSLCSLLGGTDDSEGNRKALKLQHRTHSAAFWGVPLEFTVLLNFRKMDRTHSAAKRPGIYAFRRFAAE